MTVNLAEVLELPADERLRLVEAVWNSLAKESGAVPLTDAQRRELDRRLVEYRRDPEAGDTWPEVRNRILNQR